VKTYRANRDLLFLPAGGPKVGVISIIGRHEVFNITVDGTWIDVEVGGGQPCCRCYRCGVLLTVDTVSVDKVIPDCHGGTYARNNIRPACDDCNSETGGPLANGAEHQQAKSSRRASLNRKCPTCGVARRKPCWSMKTGREISYIHAARKRPAR